MSSDVQSTQDDAVEAAMLARLEAGELFEDASELSPRYKEILKQTAEIASISEVSVLTWACTAYPTAPDIGAKIAVCATILDEVWHAYHQGILAEQFGVDVHSRAFKDDIKFIWEPARFTWVYTLARAFHLSEDEISINAYAGSSLINENLYRLSVISFNMS